MTDLSALRARLRALLAKTVENGCTEDEAMAAAEKAAELLSRHGLAQADLFGEDYEELEVPVGRRSPLHLVWVEIARFTDCKGWFRKRPDGLKYCYFGRASDVLVAEYIKGVIHRACFDATAEFRKSKIYARRRKPRTRAAAVKAFQEALAASLIRKLNDGLWRRYQAANGPAAKETLRLTRQTLDAEAAKRGYRFTPTRAIAKAEGSFVGDAQHHGWRAGERVEINAGLAAGNKISGVLR